MKNLYPVKALLAGLVLTQIIAAAFIFFSNADLLSQLELIESEGYLSIPGPEVQPYLKSAASAFYGAVFFTSSIGAAFSVLSLAAAWLHCRLAAKRRLSGIIWTALWLISAVGVNITGFSPMISFLVIAVPPVVFRLSIKWMPEPDESPWIARLSFVASLLLIGLIWISQFSGPLFLDVRDYVFWSNAPGRAMSDFYYNNTLYPTRLFSSLRQKTIRTCRINGDAAPELKQDLKRTLLAYDFLPIRQKAPVDLEITINGNELAFRHHDRLILLPDVDEFMRDPDRVLGRYSVLTDKHFMFRRVVRFSLLAGLPLVLYILIFYLSKIIFNLVLNSSRSSVLSGVFCLGMAALLLVPVIYGRSIKSDDIGKLLASDSWWERVAGLKIVKRQKMDITSFSYKKFLHSTDYAEGYWLTSNLGASRSPETFSDLKDLMDDKRTNTACMAFRSLGERGDVSVIPEIRKRLVSSNHWYVQWYAYNALRRLGWVQTELK